MTDYATRPTGRGGFAREEFIARLRAQGARYHNLHPFHRRMDAGELTREELQRWVANRFYYQRCIPLKDAAILANCPEVESGASGSSASSITTAPPANRAASSRGCGSARRSASREKSWRRSGGCCPRCATRSTPT